MLIASVPVDGKRVEYPWVFVKLAGEVSIAQIIHGMYSSSSVFPTSAKFLEVCKC